MKKIIVFSGTTEGKQFSNLLAEAKVIHTVCVATQYGSDVMEENAFVKIRVGRMDASEMEDFFREEKLGAGDFVVDGTHPYAGEATENIKKACASTGVKRIRIVRDLNHEHVDGIAFYDSMSECAQAVSGTQGNILLTTGSSDLAAYCKTVTDPVRARTYVRILPAEDSLASCREYGIKNIIAMQGPFSYELNRALMQQYDIRQMITKESGLSGGYDEKIRAATDLGITCHVLKCPGQETGMCVREAFEAVTGRECQDRDQRIIRIAGLGPGGMDFVTESVKAAIADADAVFGANRLIENIYAKRKYAMYKPEEIISVLEQDSTLRKITILFSGDCGFFSGAKTVLTALKKWDGDAQIRVLPGVSSVAYFAALCHESYEDATVLSLHGRNSRENRYRLAGTIRYSRKTFVLLSNDTEVREIAQDLCTAGLCCRIIVGCDLSTGSEKIVDLSPDEAKDFRTEGILIALILNEQAERRPLFPFFRDTDFLREEVPMTKESIRHESILRLKLKEGDVVYDIGGGTGSIAIETAGVHPSLKVYSFEKDEKACVLIEKNRQRCGVHNMTVIQGTAPEAFADTEDPDCVFIGGSSGRLKDIFSALTARRQNIRYVINAVSLETIDEARTIVDAYDTKDMQILQLSSSEVKNIGRHHMMQAINPVMIFSFTI